jgi:hypothetical protein
MLLRPVGIRQLACYIEKKDGDGDDHHCGGGGGGGGSSGVAIAGCLAEAGLL